MRAEEVGSSGASWLSGWFQTLLRANRRKRDSERLSIGAPDSLERTAGALGGCEPVPAPFAGDAP